MFLLGMMTAHTVETCMSNHYYTIGGDIRQQSEGGSIGSDLTGEVTRIYMLQWEENFRKKCRKAGINWDLYGRYVDDMFLAMRPISPGWDYNPKTGKMYYSEEKARNCNLTQTKRTSTIMAMIANTIEPNI